MDDFVEVNLLVNNDMDNGSCTQGELSGDAEGSLFLVLVERENNELPDNIFPKVKIDSIN